MRTRWNSRTILDSWRQKLTRNNTIFCNYSHLQWLDATSHLSNSWKPTFLFSCFDTVSARFRWTAIDQIWKGFRTVTSMNRQKPEDSSYFFLPDNTRLQISKNLADQMSKRHIQWYTTEGIPDIAFFNHTGRKSITGKSSTKMGQDFRLSDRISQREESKTILQSSWSFSWQFCYLSNQKLSRKFWSVIYCQNTCC